MEYTNTARDEIQSSCPVCPCPSAFMPRNVQQSDIESRKLIWRTVT
jgi:hypothetical protein